MTGKYSMRNQKWKCPEFLIKNNYLTPDEYVNEEVTAEYTLPVSGNFFQWTHLDISTLSVFISYHTNGQPLKYNHVAACYSSHIQGSLWLNYLLLNSYLSI